MDGMNQRQARKHPAALVESNDRQYLQFMRTAKNELEKAGYEDPAFYFGQVIDWLLEGKRLPTSEREVSRILGL